VGPVVAFSAYPQTTVTARSREEGHLSLKLAKRFLEAL
jgi:hypothetical protein